MKLVSQTLGTLALAVMSAGSAQALPLSNLLAGATITSGGMLFDQWTENFQSTSDGHVIDTANIDVTAVAGGGLNPGLFFHILGGEFNVTGDGVFAYDELNVGLRVSAIGSSLAINGTSLELTGSSVTSSGDNGSFIEARLGTGAGLGDLGSGSVESSWLDASGLTQATLDTTVFVPRGEIFIREDILVWATDVNETAALLDFSQRFSQQAVPEPAILPLLLAATLGAFGFHGFGRRRATSRHRTLLD